jgi:hypothetical protein
MGQSCKLVVVTGIALLVLVGVGAFLFRVEIGLRIQGGCTFIKGS